MLGKAQIFYLQHSITQFIMLKSQTKLSNVNLDIFRLVIKIQCVDSFAIELQTEKISSLFFHIHINEREHHIRHLRLLYNLCKQEAS
jgi:hypothetical protein